MLAADPSPTLDRAPPLVERDFALDALASAVRDAASRAGSVCLVAGGAGLGKTALIREASRRLASAARWVWGSCDPLTTPRALGPLHDAARQLGGTLAARLFEGAPRDAAFASLLGAIDDAPTPTVLVIEDLHWADQATLDLLLFVGRRVATRRAVVVATYRDDERGADPLFDATLGALARDVTRRVVLSPLTRAGVEQLAARAGRPAGDVFETTQGNPFFVTEMLASGDALTPTVRDAVVARTRLLSAEAREALDVLAVIPRPAELELLEQRLGLSRDALRESVRAGLLVADERTLAFRHELARRAIESAIDPLRQRALHEQLLGALARRQEESGDVPLAQLAHHARAAGDEAGIARWTPAAAREAAAASAHREALAHFDAALAVAGRLPVKERATLLEAWSVEAYLSGRTLDAIAARSDALVIWTTIGCDDRAGAAQRWLSRLHWWAGHPDEAMRAGEEAVRLLEGAPGHELAMAYSNLSQIHMLAHRHDESIAWGERATTLARSIGDVEALAHALVNVGSSLLRRHDEHGVAMLEDAFAMASAARLDDHAQRALVNLSLTLLDQRDYARGEPALERALRFAESHDLDAYAQYLVGHRARLYLDRGAWALAERDARAALGDRSLPGVTTIPALVVLGTLQSRRGDAAASETLERARALAYPTRELQRIGPTAIALAEHAWLAGDAGAARAIAEPALRLAREGGDEWLVGELAYRLRLAGGEATGETAAEPWRLLLDGHWRGAAARWEALGCPYERAEALAAGDDAAMREALAVFDRLGASRRAGTLRRAMRARGARVPAGPRRATRANVARLTARQVDVLRLVAEGCSNQEIADRLNLSAKTVDHHVSAILEKLDARTRREAAAAARRLGVVE